MFSKEASVGTCPSITPSSHLNSRKGICKGALSSGLTAKLRDSLGRFIKCESPQGETHSTVRQDLKAALGCLSSFHFVCFSVHPTRGFWTTWEAASYICWKAGGQDFRSCDEGHEGKKKAMTEGGETFFLQVLILIFPSHISTVLPKSCI